VGGGVKIFVSGLALSVLRSTFFAPKRDQTVRNLGLLQLNVMCQSVRSENEQKYLHFLMCIV